MRNDRIRIVIADDEQNICEMLKRLIRFDDLGLELIGMVSNGEDLRNVIVKEKPDIVITDIHMPVMDGLEVIRWCNENGCETNFIVLSGYHQFEYAYNALKTSVYKGYKQDKIEMRGDRAEMSDFPLYLNTVAGGLDRRDQTIGGFSFVVKIYAVPVVEIIG